MCTEQCFNQIKAFVRREGTMYKNNPELCFYHACQEVTPQNALNYYEAAGYNVPKPLGERERAGMLLLMAEAMELEEEK